MHGKRKSNGDDGSKMVEFDLWRSPGAKTLRLIVLVVATVMRIESFLPEMPMIATNVKFLTIENFYNGNRTKERYCLR